MRLLAGDRIEVLSAGSKPGSQINLVAVAAMAEEGIDIAGNQPKVVTTEAVHASEVVITMGCGDECPNFPGKRYEDWKLDETRRRRTRASAVRTVRTTDPTSTVIALLDFGKRSVAGLL